MSKSNYLHIIMEHFSFEMQDILDDYQAKKLTLGELEQKYKDIGTESHDILAYKDLLEHARENNSSVKLHGGFIPRTFARKLFRDKTEEGISAIINEVVGLDYVPKDTKVIEGSEWHYSMFESMISRRDMYDSNLKPSDQFRHMFKSQLLKDIAMAHKVNKVV